MQEARAASAIDHQNICTIHDIGSTMEGQLYMAPERILEMPFDPRSDIFSLGVLMCEMPTKRRLFAGSSPAEAVMNVLDKEAEPVVLVSPSRPELLERIVHTALAKDASDRYPSVLDLRNRLLVETSEASPESEYRERRALSDPPTVSLTPSCQF
jgi:serine/threonine protein kinase